MQMSPKTAKSLLPAELDLAQHKCCNIFSWQYAFESTINRKIIVTLHVLSNVYEDLDVFQWIERSRSASKRCRRLPEAMGDS